MFSVQRKATPGNMRVVCWSSVNSRRWMVWAVLIVWKWLEMTDMTDLVSRLRFSMKPQRLLSHTPLRKRVITVMVKLALRWIV